jgi:outer membrane protein OmpA-like peptidoglycan-associated protein
MNDVPFPTNWVKGGPIQQCNTNIVLGYMYNFGLTKADQELLAQKGALRNDNCDALNDQINDLASELATSKQNERKLENRVNDLENELAMAKKNQNDAANSELQKRIDQMKNDQLTYYALPFSVNYDVNQYTVTDEEQIKLKAIANVMKADSELKLNIVGFCDATGSDEYNQKLSQKRAENVKNILVKKYGVDGDRLTCDWKGKTVAFGDGQNAINRRVSFYRMID